MKITIESKKYGSHIVQIDDEDYEKIKPYKWHINYHNKNAYATTCQRIKNKEGGKAKIHTYKMHRLILGFPDKHIDHKDGDGLNNQKINLRLVEPRQNTKNRSISDKNTSGYKGVCFSRKSGQYQAQIRVDRKMIWGGYYSNPIDAAKKYNEMAIVFHKEFAKLNVIPNE